MTFPKPCEDAELAGSCRAWHAENGAKTIKISMNLISNIGNTT